MAIPPIRVFHLRESANSTKGTPDHWVDDKPTGFKNPWSSWRGHTPGDFLTLAVAMATAPRVPCDIAKHMPVRRPTWGLEPDKQGDADKQGDDVAQKDQIKATWLGHACFLVELPARFGLSRGPRILFDPVFSDRCSPVQFMGPKRFTPPPCDIEDITEVDAIVISHNHYDHLDTMTLKTLFQRTRKPHIFAPLGNGPFFRHLGIAESHVHLMDWWESKHVEVDIPATAGDDSTQTAAFDVTCTPCQHFTGRGLLDRFKSLWASWVVEEAASGQPDVQQQPSDSTGVKLYFAGDTGYRSVPEGMNEDEVPTCPVFSEIGERFGGFDLAMIPIGAYLPRSFMSPIHCAPQDSVRIFKDIRAQRALGMHWGTWMLTSEEVTEPPKRLAEECRKAGIEEGAFQVCEIGQTMFF